MRITALVLGTVLLTLAINTVVLGQNVLLSIPASSGPIGEEVNVPVNIGSTTDRGIIAAEMTIEYNSRALIATGVNSSGTMTEGWLVYPNTTNPGEIIISMAGMKALSGSGVLLYLRFVVQPTARIGTVYPLTFARARLNEGNPGVATQNGTFTPEQGAEPERIPGDANGDDHVNHLDVLKLILSYGKSTGENGYNPDADFDDSGRVDINDVKILLRNFGK